MSIKKRFTLWVGATARILAAAVIGALGTGWAQGRGQTGTFTDAGEGIKL